jgi:hypothetical protein
MECLLVAPAVNLASVMAELTNGQDKEWPKHFTSKGTKMV